MLISSHLVNTVPSIAPSAAAAAVPSAPALAARSGPVLAAPSVGPSLLDLKLPSAMDGPASARAATPADAPAASPAEAPAAKPASQGPVQPPPGTPQAVPSFITPASLVTVSGGTATVTLLWQVSKLLVGKPAGAPWVAFLISIMVGSVIYLASIQDEKVHATSREKAVGMFIGFVNSMVLFAAAVGILGR
jgi:hypothetical protein